MRPPSQGISEVAAGFGEQVVACEGAAHYVRHGDGGDACQEDVDHRPHTGPHRSGCRPRPHGACWETTSTPRTPGSPMPSTPSRSSVSDLAAVGFGRRVPIQRAPRSRGFTPIPKRWTVERTYGWLIPHGPQTDRRSHPKPARNLTWDQTRITGPNSQYGPVARAAAARGAWTTGSTTGPEQRQQITNTVRSPRSAAPASKIPDRVRHSAGSCSFRWSTERNSARQEESQGSLFDQKSDADLGHVRANEFR